MVLWILVVLAFALGWYRATKRGGTLADKVQYGIAHAVPVGLLVLVLMVIGANYGWFVKG